MIGDHMDLKALTDDDLDGLRVGVLTEQERRARLAAIPAQMAAMADTWRDAGRDTQELVHALTDPEEPTREAST